MRAVIVILTAFPVGIELVYKTFRQIVVADKLYSGSKPVSFGEIGKIACPDTDVGDAVFCPTFVISVCVRILQITLIFPFLTVGGRIFGVLYRCIPYPWSESVVECTEHTPVAP